MTTRATSHPARATAAADKGGSRTTGTASRGKRKLDFNEHRFRGKLMFLDLAGYRRAAEIERELEDRGATIEKFFHRGVGYLVTMRPKDVPQSPSTPSPLTPGTAKSAVSQVISPSTGSPHSAEARPVQPRVVQTRAQKMLQLSMEKQKSMTKQKVDLVAMAPSWGCKVVYLDELLSELKRLRPLPRREPTRGREAKKSEVQALKVPFFKVDDPSQNYRPLVYETGVWPRPDPHCSPKACPFDSPKHAGGATGVAAGARDRKAGYCECCLSRYKDLQMHLQSSKHLEYATNPANFSSLDALIARGVDFDDFISRVRAEQREITTTTASTSPATPSRKRPRAASVQSPPKASSNAPVPAPVQAHHSPSPKRFKPHPLTGSPTVNYDPTTPPSQSQSSRSPASRHIALPQDAAPQVLSPHRRGELRITPVVAATPPNATPPIDGIIPIGHEYTPGFVTPGDSSCDAGVSLSHVSAEAVLSVGQRHKPRPCSKIDVIALQLSLRAHERADKPAAPTTAERRRGESPSTPPPKKLCIDVEKLTPPSSRGRTSATPPSLKGRASATPPRAGRQSKIVPETPQKRPRLSPPTALCNIRSLRSRLPGADSPHVLTNASSPSSGHSSLRKSPRLLARESPPVSVVSRTAAIIRFSPPDPGSLVVSIELRKVVCSARKCEAWCSGVRLSHCGREVWTPRNRVRTPVVGDALCEHSTPEISLQGMPPRHVPAHPLSPLVAPARLPPDWDSLIGCCPGDSSCSGGFVGFSPRSVVSATPQFWASLPDGGASLPERGTKAKRAHALSGDLSLFPDSPRHSPRIQLKGRGDGRGRELLVQSPC